MIEGTVKIPAKVLVELWLRESKLNVIEAANATSWIEYNESLEDWDVSEMQQYFQKMIENNPDKYEWSKDNDKN